MAIVYGQFHPRRFFGQKMYPKKKIFNLPCFSWSGLQGGKSWNLSSQCCSLAFSSWKSANLAFFEAFWPFSTRSILTFAWLEPSANKTLLITSSVPGETLIPELEKPIKKTRDQLFCFLALFRHNWLLLFFSISEEENFALFSCFLIYNGLI